jgi:hypothetical protein
MAIKPRQFRICYVGGKYPGVEIGEHCPYIAADLLPTHSAGEMIHDLNLIVGAHGKTRQALNLLIVIPKQKDSRNDENRNKNGKTVTAHYFIQWPGREQIPGCRRDLFEQIDHPAMRFAATDDTRPVGKSRS